MGLSIQGLKCGGWCGVRRDALCDVRYRCVWVHA